MWFAENKSWSQFRRSLGGFSAIVCKDGSTVWAEDASGKTIASGEAGVDDASVIQSAINSLDEGIIKLAAEKFMLKSGLVGKDHISIIGSGFGTILDVTEIGTDDVIRLGNYCKFGNLKIQGTISPLPKEFTQAVIAGNYTKIFDLWITDTGYGIATTGKTDVTIENVIITNVRDEKDWAAAIRAGPTSDYSAFSNRIYIRNFYIEGCNRGIEVEDGAEWVIAENGFLKNIQNYNATGAEPFTLDAHSHGEYFPKHIRYRNIRVENAYPPQSRGSGNEDIVWENIWIIYPLGRIIIEGEGIIARNVHSEAQLFSIYNTADRVVVEKCYWTQYAENPALEIKGKNITIKECVIVAHPTSPHDGIVINDDAAENIKIENNVFQGSFPNVINITNVSGNVFIGRNTFPSGVTAVTGLTNLAVIDDNYNWVTKNSGTATFSGDGSTTDFLIGAHGLSVTDPSKIVVKVSPVSQDAINASPCVGYVDPADNTKIRVKFASAPVSGADNVQIVWHAEVIS